MNAVETEKRPVSESRTRAVVRPKGGREAQARQGRRTEGHEARRETACGAAALALIGPAFSVGGGATMGAAEFTGAASVLVSGVRLCSLAAAMLILLRIANEQGDDDDDGGSGGVPVPLYVRVDEDRPRVDPMDRPGGPPRY